MIAEIKSKLSVLKIYNKSKHVETESVQQGQKQGVQFTVDTS